MTENIYDWRKKSLTKPSLIIFYSFPIETVETVVNDIKKKEDSDAKIPLMSFGKILIEEDN